MKNDEIKTTVVSRRIARKIQTRQYESADIEIECKDTIEWTSLEERQIKLRNLTQLAIIDFQETFVEVCNALGIEQKTAFIKSNKSKPDEDKKTIKKDKVEDISDIFDGLK